jgi:hypothetical protein
LANWALPLGPAAHSRPGTRRPRSQVTTRRTEFGHGAFCRVLSVLLLIYSSCPLYFVVWPGAQGADPVPMPREGQVPRGKTAK